MLRQMRIIILTQPLKNNYGGILQNYALQQILIGLGHDVCTFDWRPKNAPTIVRLLSFLKTCIYKMLGRNRQFVYVPSTFETDVIEKNFRTFIGDNIIRINIGNNPESLESYVKDYNPDCLIVGSDQCWRASYNYGFEMSMFFSFAQKLHVKRVSYSASFGTDQIEYSRHQLSKIKNLISEFDKVSVREKSGVRICKDIFGINAMQVLDPAMLIDVSKYVNLVNKYHEEKHIGNLFYYILDPNSKVVNFIQTLENEHNMKAFTVMPRYYSSTISKNRIRENISECIYPTVTSWIRAYMDAEFIIVDSFHGCVFSILFNKPFWVLCNKNRGSSRFDSLLELFELQNRLIDIDNLSDWNFCEKIDWDRVNLKLSQKREDSITFLKNL